MVMATIPLAAYACTLTCYVSIIPQHVNGWNLTHPYPKPLNNYSNKLMSSLSYFIFVLVAIIIGVVVIKKVTGCLIRFVVVSVLLAVLAYLYFTYFSA